MENIKTLILNNDKDKNFKAILNLKATEPSCIKFLNINSLNKNFALGIKQNENVLKIPLEINNNLCAFELPKNFNIKNKFFCAVVDVTNAFCPEIILSGSINEVGHNEIIESAFIKTKPEKIEELYEEEKDEQLQSIIDKNLEEDLNTVYYDNCSKCKYRQAFYNDKESQFCSCKTKNRVEINQEKQTKIKSENIKPTEEGLKNLTLKQPLGEQSIQDDKEPVISEEMSFYDQIKPQIDTLFAKYKKEDNLENIISNSKWIKVEYEKDNSFYVLGLVFNDDFDRVEYIGYGIPSQDDLNPPEELKNFAQWLPINFNNEVYKGYWLVYQEAKNGETINVKMV